MASNNYLVKRISPEEPTRLQGGDQVRLGAKDGGALFHVVDYDCARLSVLNSLQVESTSSSKRGRDTVGDPEKPVKKEKADGPVRGFGSSGFLPCNFLYAR